MSVQSKSWTEEVKVSSENLLNEIKKIIEEGNVTHIVIKNEQGHTVVEFPINIGIIGVLLVPILAAVAAIAVYAAHFTVVVTRDGSPPPPPIIEPS